MSCPHPDPKTVPWLFCRTCGFFAEGVRMGDATDEVLRERMRDVPPGTRVSLNNGQVVGSLLPTKDDDG